MRIVADTKMEFAREPFSRLGDVRWLPTPEITRSAVADADAILVRSETGVNRELLDGTRVRFVGTATIGTDHVDLPYLTAHGIAFASAPGSNANSVGEYLVAALLELGRRRGIELAGMTIGIVGAGNVGSRVARYARALGMRVLLNDPPLARETGSPEFLPLDRLMGADVISLHVPLTTAGADPTHHLFDAARIGGIKPRGIIVNTSRGGVVESKALRGALREERCSAVLDVWEGEPAIDAELLARAEIGTAHIAGFSLDGKINAARMLFTALASWSRGTGEWSTPSAIPPPRVPRIEIATSGEPDQEIARRAVAQAYSITEDDALLRSTFTPGGGEPAPRFRSLRAQYGTRREFHAHAVVLSPARRSAALLLSNLGFHVV